jgi:hypothetical protein
VINRPSVVDPKLGDTRPVHIRSTAWGIPWPPNAPALCGELPQEHWKLRAERVTCAACLQVVRLRDSANRV